MTEVLFQFVPQITSYQYRTPGGGGTCLDTNGAEALENSAFSPHRRACGKTPGTPGTRPDVIGAFAFSAFLLFVFLAVTMSQV